MPNTNHVALYHAYWFSNNAQELLQAPSLSDFGVGEFIGSLAGASADGIGSSFALAFVLRRALRKKRIIE